MIFGYVSVAVWLMFVVSTGGFTLLSLVYIIPGLAVASANGHPWHYGVNWLVWLGPFGLLPLFVRRTA
jgi:hypothetical protein